MHSLGLDEADRRSRPSERDRFTENTVTHVSRHAFLGDDIDIDPKTVLQVIGKGNQVEQRATLRHIYKEIEIASGALLPPSGRAEHAHAACPVDSSYAPDVLPNLRNGDGPMGTSSLSHRLYRTPLPG